MRKVLLYILAGSALLLVVVLGAQYSIQPQNKNTIAVDNPLLLPYTGQAVYVIGNDPEWKKFPKEKIREQKQFLALLAEQLDENENDFDGWMAVGIHKKFFNNYEGARDAWEYAKLVDGQNPLSYINLANLYGYHLGEPSIAEANFAQAVIRDFQDVSGSRYAFANFYRDLGQADRAIEWYKEALEYRPGDAAILTEIDRLGG